MSEKIFIRRNRGVPNDFPWIVSWDEPCYDNESEQFYSDDRNDAWTSFENALKYGREVGEL